MVNYYNEFDPNAAAWIRQLIADKQIPYGHVDDRSITEVTPSDLAGYVQCHWFAGIAGWPLALKLAGWPDDRPVWTASLPCQPFSSAGKQAGTDDERHLWPVFQRLVSECRPPAIFGEQVASKIAREKWFPGVCLDLQAMGYPVTALDLCAPLAGEDGKGRLVRGDQETWEPIVIGAPHIRQRLYWVAYRGMANPPSDRRERARQGAETEEGRQPKPELGGELPGGSEGRGLHSGVGDSGDTGSQGHRGFGEESLPAGREGAQRHNGTAGAAYSDFDLIPCRDGKARRTQRGSTPLAPGLPRGVVPSCDPGAPGYANETSEARVMRLKGYGNAINAPLAAMFIETCMEVIPHE